MNTIIFSAILIIGIYYLIRNFVNLKKAIDLSENALFPVTEEHFSSVLFAGEWKNTARLSKRTRSYQIVKWGTGAALIVLAALLVIVFFTDWLSPSFFSFAYLFFLMLNAVKHPANFYIVPNGIILDSKFIATSDIKEYSVERIVRWHALYGLDSRANYGYKLSFQYNKKLMTSNFMVVTEKKELETVIELLDAQGIRSTIQLNEPASTVGSQGSNG
ncbi:hypothetical protein A8F94_14025 [Bacillus sp. FJAT-27225]|uniref:hypothetical protein n=1 Tax=Bacillus sp. FJAT-27225 TaxID=1743144 RepID=UPI00080C2F27|nr:hypothetical protein [Bacillus sp. FJAT-27225]OCA85960.1 hypothetical protein A8F94_14025 [Bacillus sp. FJAT-27225]